jgi:hypothetical protein
MCKEAMKPALTTNRMAKNMIDKLQIRCVNRGNINGNGDGDGDGNGNGDGDGDGDGGPPPAKKIKRNAGGAAVAAAAPVAAGGCEWIGAIEDVSKHMAVCGFEVLTCNFAGKCEYTYLRGVGRDTHDRESVHVHLNHLMSLNNAQAGKIDAQTVTIEQLVEKNNEQARTIDDQERTIEQQTRKLDIQAFTNMRQTERINELASTKLQLKGTVSDITPLTLLTSDTIWFGGSQVKLTVEKSIDDEIGVFLFHRGTIESPTYRRVDVFVNDEMVATLTHVKLDKVSMLNGLKWHYNGLYIVDEASAAIIKEGEDVYAIIYR